MASGNSKRAKDKEENKFALYIGRTRTGYFDKGKKSSIFNLKVLQYMIKVRKHLGELPTFKIMHLVDNISDETFFQVAGADHNHTSRNAVTVIPDDTTKTT